MSSTSTPPEHRGEWLSALSQKVFSLFFNVPFLIALNLLTLGSFITYGILNQQKEPSQVFAAVPHISAVQITGTAPSLTPEPSRTPFYYLAPTSTPTASPTLPSSPTSMSMTAPLLPAKAEIESIIGHRQSMPLSCEARSAVDWAAYFGKSIDEDKFFNGLPIEVNPDKGFVGNVFGSWGQIPPNDYGVHAKPIAQRLREFGLQAKQVRDMTWIELQTEIAAGRPVIVWVIGHVGQGTPVSYTSPEGAVITVAKFEHTVIAIGYTEDKVVILDGSKVYTKYKGEFLKSWGVLENQAVIWIE
jgi:uncharacterized protein YvpB